jgi:endonuclease III
MSNSKGKALLTHRAVPQVLGAAEPVKRPKVALKKRQAKARELPVDPERIRAIFERFAALNPHPEGELDYVNPFTLLVAVVLSAQATDLGVNKATKKLFAHADNPRAMLELGENGVRDDIRTIGLFRAKAKNVVALSAKLLADYNGEVPRTREDLESLPGVGRKTANVVLNIAFGQATIAVDTHLVRVSNRIPLARGDTPVAVEQGLMRIIPPEFLLHAHHWLILHGRYICKARKPLCGICPIAEFCQFPDKTTP